MGLMPTEPPSTGWVFPDVALLPVGAEGEDLVGAGADLEPGTLLAAYRHGLFPMPAGDGGRRRRSSMLWWSPVERGVLPLDGLKVSRSLRQAARHMEVRVDTAFAAVVEACADPSREGSWIDGQIRSAYTRLHELGWAHSVEAWDADGELAGGLYGVAIGRLFAAESMFHRTTDASKAAVAGLVERIGPDALIDVQWLTPHLATLGATEIPRADYLRRLERAVAGAAGHSPLAG
jgi:leucyl/phenylalanyl-tRNA--protein transferase